MKRRLLVPALAAVGLACTAGVIAIDRDDPRLERRERPGRAALLRLQARIEQHRDDLARQGVYVEETGLPAQPCLYVSLANPSAPNIAYMRSRFGPDVCVDRTPGGPVEACAGLLSEPVATGAVTVPDLTDLGLYEAERRVVARGLTYALRCLGDERRVARRPSALRPEALARITSQCPRPGERVPRGAEIALDAKATLPGGFAYPIGVLDRYQTGSTHSCADGRNP